MVVTDDLHENYLWRAADENLMGVGSRDSRRIESINTFFKNFRCLGKQNICCSWRWSDIKKDFFFLRWELLFDICLLKTQYGRKEMMTKELREIRWDPSNKRKHDLDRSRYKEFATQLFIMIKNWT